ncbi:nitrogen fixation protein NifR, partial [Staphylococcus aureus]|nr:nitrogen fixation protein NifR [Staphylococcus aureus]
MQVGDGPQHREFRKEILQAMQVGGWAPTKKEVDFQITIKVQVG